MPLVQPVGVPVVYTYVGGPRAPTDTRIGTLFPGMNHGEFSD